MSRFQILCATMYQSDFSKIKEMNINCDVLFANQCDNTSMTRYEWDGHIASMISTTTRGVGKNRNIALLHANKEICLFADDDLIYRDDVEDVILQEFDKYPDADIIIFNLTSDSATRKQRIYTKTKRYKLLNKMPWGCVRIAFRLSSIRKANIWFSTLFGGGCTFPSGEDSLWLLEAKKKKLKFYVSKEIIGSINFEKSSWFTGYNDKFFYAKGAYYNCAHPKTKLIWMIYFAMRTMKISDVPYKRKMKLMNAGAKGFKEMIPYEEYVHSGL